MVKRKLLEIPDEDVNVNPTIAKEEEKDHEESNKPKETEVKPVEDSSVLKSLLMDRMTRKRPQSPVAAAASKVEAKRPSICGSNSGESDILRRRLLGLKAEQQQPQQLQLAPKPRFQPPSATITSQQLQDHGQSNPVDLSPSLLKAQAAHIEEKEQARQFLGEWCLAKGHEPPPMGAVASVHNEPNQLIGPSKPKNAKKRKRSALRAERRKLMKMSEAANGEEIGMGEATKEATGEATDKATGEATEEATEKAKGEATEKATEKANGEIDAMVGQPDEEMAVPVGAANPTSAVPPVPQESNHVTSKTD
jgi:hypothetical protein